MTTVSYYATAENVYIRGSAFTLTLGNAPSGGSIAINTTPPNIYIGEPAVAILGNAEILPPTDPGGDGNPVPPLPDPTPTATDGASFGSPIPFRLPYSLSIAAIAGQSLYRNTSFEYECAIGGLPFLFATSDTYKYQRKTTPWQRNQFDTSEAPGEQTLNTWWIRAQTSFQGGAGTKYYEPSNVHAAYFGFADKGSNPVQYWDSRGVDVWTAGQATLLREINNVRSDASTSYVFSYMNGATPMVVFAAGNAVWRSDGTTQTAATWGGSTQILAACSDGTNAYFATSGDIYKMNLTSGSGASLWTLSSASKVTLAWAKERLVAFIDGAFYELTGAGGALPTASWTRNTSSSWTATSITSGPDAIYVSGYEGQRGTILEFALSTTGAVGTLSSAVTVAELPPGEIPECISVYLGSYFALGTSKGIRVGVLDTIGNMQYGPLILETTNPVTSVFGADRYLYFGVQAGIHGNSGLIRVDLSTEISPLRFAYANDLEVDPSVSVDSICFLGNTNRKVLGAGGLWVEHGSNLVSQGFIQTGKIRYSTFEYKYYAGVSVRGDYSYGSISLSKYDTNYNETSLYTIDANSDTRQSISLLENEPIEELGLKLFLNRDASDHTKGPTMRGWILKALPHPFNVGETLQVPVLCSDDEETSDGWNAPGYTGWGYDRFKSLKALEAAGTVMKYQDLRTGETLNVQVDAVELMSDTPTAGASTGFGGVVYLTLREIAL